MMTFVVVIGNPPTPKSGWRAVSLYGDELPDNWEQLLVAEMTAPPSQGDSVFKEVTANDGHVSFRAATGTAIGKAEDEARNRVARWALDQARVAKIRHRCEDECSRCQRGKEYPELVMSDGSKVIPRRLIDWLADDMHVDARDVEIMVHDPDDDDMAGTRVAIQAYGSS